MYLYLYLNVRICICICIWKKKFIVFVFVFVFEKSENLYLYLYLYLIKRIWTQPWCALKGHGIKYVHSEAMELSSCALRGHGIKYMCTWRPWNIMRSQVMNCRVFLAGFAPYWWNKNSFCVGSWSFELRTHPAWPVFEIAWWTGARNKQKQHRSSKTTVFAGPKDKQLVLYFGNTHWPKIVPNTFLLNFMQHYLVKSWLNHFG